MLSKSISLEFERQYPYNYPVNLEPIGHHAIVIDHRMALRAGVDLTNIDHNIRLYIASEPGLFVAQQRFSDQGGLQKSLPKGSIPVLSLRVDKSHPRSIINIYDLANNNEESVLLYEGGGKFRLYSYHDRVRFESAPCRKDLEEILSRYKKEWVNKVW